MTTDGRRDRAAPLDPQKLRNARKGRVLSITELARRAHVSKSLISALETGASGASTETVRALAAALDLAPSVLLTDEARLPGSPDDPIVRGGGE